MRTEYIVDTFVDYAGLERKFVLAAVSMTSEDAVEDFDYIEDEHKILSLGISVCRPNDDFNEELGKRIAQGKAVKYRDHAIFASDAGLINKTMVGALLKQEAEYFKTNPGRYLAGYNKDAAKYLKDQKTTEFIENLDAEAKTAFDYVVGTLSEDDELANQFIDAVNYIVKD